MPQDQEVLATPPAMDHSSWLPICGVSLFIMISAIVFMILYACILLKITTDPLGNIPGPMVARWTRLYSARALSTGQEHLHLEAAHRKYGPVIRWQPNTVLISDSRLLPKIYHLRQNKTPHDSQSPSETKNISGDNEWQKHQEKRKRLEPLFSTKAVHQDEPLIELFVSLWINALRARFADREIVFDFSMWGNYLMLDIVNKRFFGKEFKMIENASDTMGLVESANKDRHINHALARVHFMKPISNFFVSKKSEGSGFGGVLKIRDDLYNERVNRTKFDPHVGLDQILAANQALNHDELKEDALLVLLASSDTTAHVLRMFVRNIVQTPRCYRRLRREIDQAMAWNLTKRSTTDDNNNNNNNNNNNRPQIPFSRIAALPYLTACLRESLRLEPPIVSYLTRTVDDPAGLDLDLGDGYHQVLPAGTQIGASPYVTGRDPRVFGKDAGTYRPERFLEDPAWAARVARYDFVFGHAPRQCVGMFLSNFVVAKAIVELFYNFDIEVLDHGSGQAYVNWSWSGMNIKLKNRIREKEIV